MLSLESSSVESATRRRLGGPMITAIQSAFMKGAHSKRILKVAAKEARPERRSGVSEIVEYVDIS